MNDFCYHNVDGHRYALVHMPKLEALDMSENPIEDDDISKVAPASGKILSASIQVLDVQGIGLGSSGFRELQDDITKQKPRRIEAAKFLANLMSGAPELVAVNVAYNLMRFNSSTIIFSVIKAAKYLFTVSIFFK
ncbi:protein NLRC3 [Pyrus ussuriensis x Pyrus communis]|uniref:Protein NLRC3 n=1 Tax=Pyrus ussuriensis x Pyrus communis TaxID=2448454 RepID=A0A5N5IDB2_9ROSA|nr:protein NLRC3 [Pyrus ussuriensis x Pyrus communis]